MCNSPPDAVRLLLQMLVMTRRAGVQVHVKLEVSLECCDKILMLLLLSRCAQCVMHQHLTWCVISCSCREMTAPCKLCGLSASDVVRAFRQLWGS